MLSEQIFVLSVRWQKCEICRFSQTLPKMCSAMPLIQFQHHILLSADYPNNGIFLECHLQKICGQHP